MASTSFASHPSNTRVRSWLLSPDKVQGRVNFLSLRPRGGFSPKAAVMAAGPTCPSSKALIYKPVVQRLSPVEEQEAASEESDQEKRDPITDENLDEWIKDSVSEIVKNVGEAPFLMQFFPSGEAKGVRVEREAATPESWRQIQKRWARKKSQPPPAGIILVSELRDDLVEEGKEHGDGHRESSGSDSRLAAGSSKVWGLVVQGRGMEFVACYILNTCRVLSPAGSLTHFCLARAQCFGDPVEVQLRNAWLQ